MMKEIIKDYFKMRLFTEEDLEVFVKSNYITEQERIEIIKGLL